MYLFGILYTLPYILFNNINHEYTNRILSTINSLYISITALCYQSNLIEYSIFNYAVKTCAIWFASDIMYMYFTNYNTKLYYIHHIITVSVISLGISDIVNPEYICIMFLTEITTIFMNISWYLNITKSIEKYKKLTIYIHISIILSWIYYRIYNLIKLLILMKSNNSELIYLTISFIYLLLNIFWFYKITNMIYKKLK